MARRGRRGTGHAHRVIHSGASTSDLSYPFTAGQYRLTQLLWTFNDLLLLVAR
jgi:hypothetical protein